MDDGRWYLANIVLLSGFSCYRSSRTLELWTSIVVSSCDNDGVSQGNQSDFRMVYLTGFSVLCRELLLCSTSSGNGVEIVRGEDAL